MSLISEQADQLTQSLYHEKSHRHVEHSVSTNSELIAMVTDGELSANQVHLRTADTQSGGRGQGSRSWQSPKGNVYLSLYYPTKHTHFPLIKPISGLLSLCVGYCLAQLPIIQEINQLSQCKKNSSIGVKWANDIGFYEFLCPPPTPPVEKEFSSDSLMSKGEFLFRKLSGILIEPVLSHGKMIGVVIGVGLNVANAPVLSKQTQEGMRYQSVSLADLVSPVPTLLGEMRWGAVQGLDSQLSKEGQWLAHDFYQPISKAIFQAILTHQAVSADDNKLAKFLADFAKLDILQGRKLAVTQTDKYGENGERVQTGTAVGIDKFGCLRLQGNDGTVNSLFTGKIEVVG